MIPCQFIEELAREQWAGRLLWDGRRLGRRGPMEDGRAAETDGGRHPRVCLANVPNQPGSKLLPRCVLRDSREGSRGAA